MARIHAPLLLILSLFTASPSAAALVAQVPAPPSLPAPAADVIDRVIAAYGGMEALAKVRAYRMEGTLVPGPGGPKTPFTRVFLRPDHLWVEVRYPDRPETRILAGKTGWRTDPAGAMPPVEGFLLDSMVLQAARADLPWILDERRNAVRMAPPGGESKGVVLELTPAPGLLLRVTVDPATNLVTASEGFMENGPMAGGGFMVAYSDYRPVEGVLFAFRESSWAMGQPTGETTVEKVVLNPTVDDSEFRP